MSKKNHDKNDNGNEENTKSFYISSSSLFSDWINSNRVYSRSKSEFNESISELADLIADDKFKIDIVKRELPKSSTISRQRSLKNISDAYLSEKLVFVLGAGVSSEFGVPAWNELLQNLMVHTIKKDNNVSNVLSRLFNDIFTPHPLIAGRYLQDYFENNNSSFESMVRDVLYSNIEKNKKSAFFEELIKICVAPGKSPNLDSIITYNFDDILEHKLNQTGLDVPYKSVFGVGIEVKSDELPIYHVHGYLPESKKLNEANKITFGESNYHQQYSDIYSWNNIVQINKFRENTCIFIGSSLTDPNIRRLLDIAYKQKGNKRKHHYIFKVKIDKKSLSEKLKSSLNSPEILSNKNNAGLDFEETIDLLTDIHERFEENDSASFGVQTIWIKKWDEVPVILRNIREKVS